MGKPAEAEAECRNAVSLIQRLVNEDPSDTDLRNILSQCNMTLGVVLLQGQAAEAEVECRKAQGIAERLTADYPSLSQYGYTLALAFAVLGDVVRSSGRAAEAKSFYDRAIALLEQRFKEEPLLAWAGYPIVYSMRRRALALRDVGDPAGAAADIRQALLRCDGSPPSTTRWKTACCHATLAGLAGQAGSAVATTEREAEAARAVECLSRAVASGYRNTNQLRIESALDLLRDRADFKKLVAELERKSPQEHERK